jgi:hypothetical protein
VGVHSLTLSYTPKNIKCDSHASLLARTFASPYFGHKPKAKVATYLVNKPQVSRKIVKWLLLFLEYDFKVLYKLGRTHVIVDALSRLLDIIEPTGVSNQTTYAGLFYVELK